MGTKKGQKRKTARRAFTGLPKGKKVGPMKQLYMWTTKASAEARLKKLEDNKSAFFQLKQKGKEWTVFFGKWK